MTFRTHRLFAMALLFLPALAHAEDDPTTAAVNQISSAVFQGAANRIEQFKSQSRPNSPARRGIDFYTDNVTIMNVPRQGGNRFVEVRIPGAEPNLRGSIPQLVITAERAEGSYGGPAIMVQIPVGRRGDYPLNALITSGGTHYQLGLRPIPSNDAATLLAESGFRPSGALPPEAKGVITALHGVKGIPALDAAKPFLRLTPPAAAKPVRGPRK